MPTKKTVVCLYKTVERLQEVETMREFQKFEKQELFEEVEGLVYKKTYYLTVNNKNCMLYI